MKRYMLFAGSAYYPAGGWDDFKGDFDNIATAVVEAARLREDWYHVIDLETGEQAQVGGA